jgi:hypothetical protein
VHGVVFRVLVFGLRQRVRSREGVSLHKRGKGGIGVGKIDLEQRPGSSPDDGPGS